MASSCLVQTGWDHAVSEASNRLSTPFQVYREVRHQDVGFGVVTTRSKVRGRGGAFGMKLSTEPGKECQIVGWNLALTGNKFV